MKITYKGDYALKAILALSYNYDSGNVVPLVEISAQQDIPEKYLEQIMLILKRAGYVTSKRGIGGGFSLMKSPKEITLGEIIRVIEGSIEPIACGIREYDCCGEEEKCVFREVWLKVTRAITDIVDTVTFEHLMKRSDELQEECGGYSYQI
ncbi:Rrf2 family transcriptional regulator [bacterium]|nr:Rrf2 family transcriptional regulator [bacterium]